MEGRRVVGVVSATMDINAIDTVFMDALFVTDQQLGWEGRGIEKSIKSTNMRRAKNRSIPVAHHHIVPIRKAIRACLYS